MVKKLFVIRDVDVNNSSGSALFNGQPVYGFCDTFKFAENALLQSDVKTLANPSEYGVDENHLGSNWKRRSTDTAFIGIDKPIITMNGNWTAGSQTLGVGSQLSNGSLILTPHKLIHITRSGRPVYICDEYLIPTLIDGDTGLENSYWSTGELTGSAYSIGSSYYNKYGVKGLFKSDGLDVMASTTNMIKWSAILWEDKEETE